MEATAIVPASSRELVALEPMRPDRHPVTVYLARLSEGSRRTMREALDTIAAR